MKRRIGPKRAAGTRTGLTKTQAEAELRRLIGDVTAAVPRQDRLTLEEAGGRYIDHLETVKRRKPTTITDYRTILRRHLVPFTAGRTIDAVAPALIRSYVSAKLREGLSPKTVRNHVVFAHGLFAHAVARGWLVPTRSIARTCRPRVGPTRTSATCAPRSSRLSTAPCPTTTSAQPSACST